MADFSNHQKKIIDRYYNQRDSIMLARLQELVTELYLADSQKKQDQLWNRAETAMQKLGIQPTLIAHIVESRKPETLARNVQDWTVNPPTPSDKRSR